MKTKFLGKNNLDKNLKGIVYGAINNNKATLNKLWT